VPDDLAVELQAAVANGPATADPATPPASIARCEQLLGDSLGRVVLSASPAYVIPPGTAFFQPAARIVRSDGEETETLRGQNPKGANWSPDEWQQLLNGDFGPWAVAMVGKQIISICHSAARLTDRGAEAGVWTDPDFRGRGHAAAVTAAWASLLAPSGRHLFYSHSSTNLSSQRVAARLGLRPIGWRWQLSSPWAV
jgi:RimJ/RimL family protein N-acetyltransferase